MKAYDTRMKYTEKLYATTCKRCGAEIEGELNEFKFISRFTVTCKCPACGGHNTLYAFKLRPRLIVKGIRQIPELEV